MHFGELTLIFDSSLAARLPGLLLLGPLLLSFLNAAGTVKHRIALAVGAEKMFGRPTAAKVEDGDEAGDRSRIEGDENVGVMILLVSVLRARLAKRVASAIGVRNMVDRRKRRACTFVDLTLSDCDYMTGRQTTTFA